MTPSIWKTLGCKPGSDLATVRRAYAARLKQVHPEDDPAGFQALREAYERAVQLARGQRRSAFTPQVHFDAHEPEVEADVTADGFHHAAAHQETWRVSQDADDAASGWDDGVGRDWSAAPRPAPPAPPPPSAEVLAEREMARVHRALMDDLIRTLHADPADPQTDPQAALSALLRLLRSPGMGALVLHEQTEHWLAQLLSTNRGPVGPLIEPTIQFFGWDHSRIQVGRGAGRHSPGEAVLHRREQIRALEKLVRPGAQNYDAYKILIQPLTFKRRLQIRLSPDLAKQAARLLYDLGPRLPELAERFDPETVAWWRTYLSRPRIAASAIWLIAIGGPLLACVLGVTGLFGAASLATTAALLTVSLSVFLVPVLVMHYAVAVPRWIWRRRDVYEEPLWRRIGWAPVLLVCLFSAGLIPPGWWGGLLIVPAFGALLWALVVSDPDYAPPPVDKTWALPRYRSIITLVLWVLQPFWRPGIRHHWALASVFAFTWLALFWVFNARGISVPALAQIGVPLLCAVVAFSAGAGTVRDAWSQITPSLRRVAALGIAALGIAGAVVLWALPAFRPVGMVMLSAAVFLHKAPGAELTPHLYIVRELAMRLGWLVWPFVVSVLLAASKAPHHIGLRSGALVLLTGVLLACLSPFLKRPPSPYRDRFS